MAIQVGDYSYVDDPSDGETQSKTSEIRVDADNAWNGVQFRYGSISARVLEGDQAELSYDLTVTNQDPEKTEEIENDSNFQTYVGDILMHILDNAFENEEYRIGGDESTNDNTTESVAQ